MVGRFRTKPSDLAAIVDDCGGIRTVVGPAREFSLHVRPGEMLFQVPGFKIREPVPWYKVPHVIALARREVDRWIETRNDPDLPMALKMYQLRKSRTYQRESVHLPDICET